MTGANLIYMIMDCIFLGTNDRAVQNDTGDGRVGERLADRVATLCLVPARSSRKS